MKMRSVLLESTLFQLDSVYSTYKISVQSHWGGCINSLSTASKDYRRWQARFKTRRPVMPRTATIASLEHLYGIAFLIDQFFFTFSLSILRTFSVGSVGTQIYSSEDKWFHAVGLLSAHTFLNDMLCRTRVASFISQCQKVLWQPTVGILYIYIYCVERQTRHSPSSF